MPDMTQQAVAHDHGFGATRRVDNWWIGPLATAAILMAFVVYSTWAAFQGSHYWVNGTNYLSPFYSPELWGMSPHRLFAGTAPSWWPSGLLTFSAAFIILGVPAGFRLTCYYYRKAYYRSIWLDPVACSVGEARKGYWGENRLPLILWNAHRYMLYLAIILGFILLFDGIKSFWFPVDAAGNPFNWVSADGQPITAANQAAYNPAVAPAGWRFGIGLGSLVLIINPLLIMGYTFGCHCLRHIVGGRVDNFSCAPCGKSRFKLWQMVSRLNEHHGLWAMASLVWVGLADVYVRLVSNGVIPDPRIIF